MGDSGISSASLPPKTQISPPLLRSIYLRFLRIGLEIAQKNYTQIDYGVLIKPPKAGGILSCTTIYPATLSAMVMHIGDLILASAIEFHRS